MMKKVLFLFAALGLAACPSEPTAGPGAGQAQQAKVSYSCPMHPDVTSDSPGECSKCGMALEKSEEHDHDAHEHGDKHEGMKDHKGMKDHDGMKGHDE